MSFPEPPGQTPGPWGDPTQWPAPTMEMSEQPSSVRTAVRLMYLGAAYAVVEGVVDLVLARDRAGDSRFLSDEEVDSLAAGERVAAVVGTAIVVGLWLWMAYANGQGQRWARVVGTVFGCIAILGGVASLLFMAAGDVDANDVFGLLGVPLAVWILVLLYRPDANRYFESY